MEAQGMVEMVARAMIAKHYGPEGSDEFEEILHNFGDSYRESARAALEAMREPTEGMGRIAREERAFLDLPSYRSLIDAALNEHQEK